MSFGRVEGGQSGDIVIGGHRSKTGRSASMGNVTNSPTGKAAKSSPAMERSFSKQVASGSHVASNATLRGKGSEEDTQSPRSYSTSELDEMDTVEIPELAMEAEEDSEEIHIGGFKNEFTEVAVPPKGEQHTVTKNSPSVARKIRDVGKSLLSGVRGLVSEVGTKLKPNRKTIELGTEVGKQIDLQGDAQKAIGLAKDEIARTKGAGKPLRGTSDARVALGELNKNLLKSLLKEPLEQLFKKLPNDRSFDLSQEEDQKLLTEFFGDIAKVLNTSSDNMRIFKEVCNAIKESVQENGIDAEEALGIAADQLFLQILNPAIAAPATLGLPSHEDAQVRKNAIAFSTAVKLVVQGTTIRATDVAPGELAKIDARNTFLSEKRGAILEPVKQVLFSEAPSIKTLIQEQKEWSPKALSENRPLFEALKEWSKAKHMDENILYIDDACQALKEQDPKKFKDQLREIYFKYMAPDSDKEINISGKYKKALFEVLNNSSFDQVAMDKAKKILEEIMTLTNKDGLNRESMLTRDLFNAFKQEKG